MFSNFLSSTKINFFILQFDLEIVDVLFDVPLQIPINFYLFIYFDHCCIVVHLVEKSRCKFYKGTV